MNPGVYGVIKRGIDLMVSLCCLVLLLVPFALVAVAIRLDSPGPALFRQRRPGRGGRPFRIWKFRTMAHRPGRTGAEPPPQSADVRVTRIGTWLRRSGIDELPQLVNVLRGEMSLVGPRPTLLERAERYDARQRRRLLVKPGITGWAVIAGRNDLTWDEKIAYDLWYVDHASLTLDLRILAKTPGILLGGKGIYMPPDDGLRGGETR